ncbi:MAG: aldo/keto reductase [Muribaculaceae bacterium]|nr:aldo/keto reductase [Muribaculaceae bacterium]
MSKNTDNNISRRRFLRDLGIFSGAAVAGSALTMCKSVAAPEKEGKDGEKGMTMRVNPNSNDTVSILGYGCMRFPTMGLSSGKADDDRLDQEAINASVDAALEGGVNYFDTSPAYCKGNSEAAIGEALSRHPRESYYIATKLSNFAPQTWTTEASKEMFENSLKNLRTDYVDYYLLHAIGMGGVDAFNQRYVDNGILPWLVEQKEKGRIRNLGFSFHGPRKSFDEFMAMMDRGEIHWDFVQIQLNYMDWLHAEEGSDSNTNADYLYSELHKRGIPVVIMEPLLGGRLASVAAPVAAKMKERRPDDSTASWAFRFAGSPEGVLTVLSGMTYMEHLRDNLTTYSPLDPVSDDEKAFLERCALEILQNNLVPCTNCKYCMPCPYGIDIPGTFKHYNTCINEGNAPRDGEDPDYRRARRAFLYGYDRSVPRLRQATRCISCGTCTSHCPQSIDIPTELHRIDAYIESLKQNLI